MTVASLPPRLIEMARIDQSVAQAMAALIEGADESGTCTLNVLASQFRETHLGQDHLGLDEVREYLMASLLPRLEQEGLLVLPSDRRHGDPDLPIEVSPALWEVVGSDRVAVTHLLRAEAGAAQPTIGAQNGSSVLVANGLVKVYRRRKVVNDVALRLQQGEIVGLLGPNGAGKTTTFYMIVGLIPPMAGRILLDGEDITEMPMYRRARRGVGYLSQEPSVFRKLSVRGQHPGDSRDDAVDAPKSGTGDWSICWTS